MGKLIFNTTETKQTKGFIQKTVDIYKKDRTKISLKEVKKMAEQFNKDCEGKGKYLIRGRNQYKDNLTIRDFGDRYYDQDNDYYDARGYEKAIYDDFYMIQLVYVKDI